MEKTPKVAVTRCFSYNAEELYPAVRKVCENADFPDVRGKTVLIKPNILSDAKPQECITTHPEVVRCLIKLLKEKGAAGVLVGDSPGMQGASFEPKNCGIAAVCAEEGAQWQDFTKKPVTRRINGTKQRLPLAAALARADVIIGACKLKTHQLMYMTGAVKNFFGTVPGLHKSSCHMSNPSRENFASLVVGLHETIKPSFSLVDAVLGMEGPGPANGTPRAVNLLLASANDYALDFTQAQIMGYEPLSIPVLHEADRRGLLPHSMEYPLLKPSECVVKDFVRIPYRERTQFFKKLIIPFFTKSYQKNKQKKEPAPQFNASACIHCKRCVNICPAHALKFEHGTGSISIDKARCIRCYCCHEMCPANAITIPLAAGKTGKGETVA